jgi:hypothetical protein
LALAEIYNNNKPERERQLGMVKISDIHSFHYFILVLLYIYIYSGWGGERNLGSAAEHSFSYSIMIQ